MNKKITALLLFTSLISPAIVSAGASSATINQVDLPEFVYADTFDNLVFDFSLNTPETTLNTLTLKNEGTTRDGFEIGSLILWLDNGNAKFDGFAVDTELGKASYDNVNALWVWQNLNKSLAAGANRFFVSAETLRKGSAGKTFYFSLPAYSDVNSNKTYDNGDAGIFFSDGSIALPTEKLLNSDAAKYKIVAGDQWAPVAVMTNLADGENISMVAGKTFTITGKAKDQGGSYLDSLDVCIDAMCKSAINTGSYFDSWKYDWSNIAEGKHSLYLSAKDFNGNAVKTAAITVSFSLVKTAVAFSKEKSVVMIDKTTAAADGVDQVKIDVTVNDSSGSAIANKIIFLNEIVDGSAVVVKSKTTDAAGKVSFKARSAVSGVKNITITTEDGDTVKDKFNLEYTKVTEDIDYTTGSWIKLENQSAVYFLDKNNVRHAYPTQAVWESYFGKDFSFVKKVSADAMASYSLGRNVPFKLGTLMKIPSVNKVYYVSQNAKISWIIDASVAQSMFGTDWAKKVKDLPEAFFTDYAKGADLN